MRKDIEKIVTQLIEVNREIKEMEKAKKEEEKPLKEELSSIKETYSPILDPLEKLNVKLREALNELYSETEPLVVEEIGSVTFQTPFTFEVVDMKKVPIELLSINAVAVREEIKKGVRKIKGLEIKKGKVMYVRQWEEKKEE